LVDVIRRFVGKYCLHI